MNLPKTKTARRTIFGLLLIVLIMSVYGVISTSQAASVAETFSNVPRATNVSGTIEPGGSGNGIAFPDGEVVAVEWWASEPTIYERYPYDEKITQLQELARSGDANAAFSAYGILNACASEPNSIEEVEERVSQLRKITEEMQQSSQPDGIAMQNAELEQRIEQMRSNFAACGRISPAEIEDREALLRQAADGNVAEAMQWLGMSTPDHDEAVAVLEQSWNLGYFQVLEHLGWRYQQSYATYREASDRQRAIAALYLYAALLDNAQSLNNQAPNLLATDAWDVVERYARRFDDNVVQESIDLAKSMIKDHVNCCSAR